jgi:hypothetical protein
MRPHVVQSAALLCHFDESFAKDLYAGLTPTWMTHDEAALVKRTDPRAFRTDPERPLRLLAALLEEFPVSCAIVGRKALPAFVSSALFRGGVVKGRLVVDAFGDWLLPRAGATALLELAIALSRRRRPRRSRVDGGLARAPGVELARVPEGTLAHYAQARARLGDKPHEAVAHGRRVDAGPAAEPTAPAMEELLVEDGPEGPGVSTCAAALYSLLAYAREGRARDDLVEEARRLGADDEAAEVVDGLVADGLLAPVRV